jgi:predicted phage terminase large subunit-like protein
MCQTCGGLEGRPFWHHEWLLERCRDAQFRSANVLDIWARYHCKSTIKTFALTLFQLINNPNETIGIFSITKANAEGFLRTIKTELEANELLRGLYPDVFYWEPERESTLWTINKGINIRRTSNTNTASVEALGLVDSNYAGKRFSRQKYDDVVTEASITSPDMVEKTTQGWELSMATGMPGTIREYTGTFYGYGDTYHEIVRRGIQLRLFPCYEMDMEQCKFEKHTGLPLEMGYLKDKPTLFSAEHLIERERELGPSTFGCQMLCNPSAGLASGMRLEWFRQYKGEPAEVAKGKPRIIVVDSANDKKRESDYTSMWVVALGSDGVLYVVDGVRDRLNLDERCNALFDLHARWKPLEVRYEKYGMMVDTEYIRKMMDLRHYHFDIMEVKGNVRKDDRIARLVPWFARGKVYFPQTMPYVSHEFEEVDLVSSFLNEEFLRWPTGQYKDMMDSLSRLFEPEHPLPWPMEDGFFDMAATNRWQRHLLGRRRSPSQMKVASWQGL